MITEHIYLTNNPAMHNASSLKILERYAARSYK